MIYRCADCCLDTERHALTRGGEVQHVEPQVFTLITLLAERAGQIVSRDLLVEHVWRGRIVSEATIDARISAARAAIGDSGRVQSIMHTVHRVGLQMVAEVVRDAGAPEWSAGNLAETRVRLATSRDGTGIAWASRGEGLPLLRAGHWMTHLERDWENPVWRPWMERLGHGRRLVRYDLRGTGLSDRSGCTVDVDKLVEDMGAVVEDAGLDRFSIFAASQSASVACIYAARNPERVDKLTLYGGFSQGSAVRDGDVGEAMTRAFSDLILRGWGKPQVGTMRCFSSLFMPFASEEQMASFIEMQVASASPEWAVALRNVSSTIDVTDILPRVRAPVLVAHALNDALQPFAQAQRFARLLPDASLLGIDSGNHILTPDEPGFARLVDAVDALLAA